MPPAICARTCRWLYEYQTVGAAGKARYEPEPERAGYLPELCQARRRRSAAISYREQIRASAHGSEAKVVDLVLGDGDLFEVDRKMLVLREARQLFDERIDSIATGALEVAEVVDIKKCHCRNKSLG